MYNDSKTISANEVNKYIYCPYQWYYERVYGRKKIRELELVRNEQQNLEDKRHILFFKGNKYHKDFHFSVLIFKLIVKLIIIAFIALLVWWFIWNYI